MSVVPPQGSGPQRPWGCSRPLWPICGPMTGSGMHCCVAQCWWARFLVKAIFLCVETLLGVIILLPWGCGFKTPAGSAGLDPTCVRDKALHMDL